MIYINWVLLKPYFLLKCITWVFCFVNVMLLCVVPYWPVHRMEDPVTIYNKNERITYQHGDLPDLPPINVEKINREEKGATLGHEYHVITAASATYLLISSVIIILYLVDRPPKYQMLIMIFAGAVLNIVAAILEFIKHSDYSKRYHDVFGKYGYEDPDVIKPFNLVVLGMVLLFAGLTMAVDFILYFILKQDEAV